MNTHFIRAREIGRMAMSLVIGAAAACIAGLCVSCGPDRSAKAGLVIINEVACHGRDWIEIVNVSKEDQDISSWYVADDLYKSGHQYKLPEDTVMRAGEYIVIKRQEGAEAGFSFGLKCAEDTVYLLDGDQAIVDQVDIGDVDYSDTWGRLPNLTGLWRETSSTPGKINQPPLTGL